MNTGGRGGGGRDSQMKGGEMLVVSFWDSFGYLRAFTRREPTPEARAVQAKRKKKHNNSDNKLTLK